MAPVLRRLGNICSAIANDHLDDNKNSEAEFIHISNFIGRRLGSSVIGLRISVLD